MIFGRFEHRPMVDKAIPLWIPVLFAIVTPIFFAAYNMVMKHMTLEKPMGRGFNAYTLSFSSAFVSCVIIQLFAILWYWSYIAPIDWTLFAFGFVCSIFDNIGITFINKAFSCGPVGPITAYLMLCLVAFVITESIRLLKVPNYL